MIPLYSGILAEAISIASTSTTKTIYFSHFVFTMSTFQKLELLCKKSCLRPATLPKKTLAQVFSYEKHLHWLLLAFTPIKISYSNTVCNTLTAEPMFSFFLWWKIVEQKTAFSHVFSS